MGDCNHNNSKERKRYLGKSEGVHLSQDSLRGEKVPEVIQEGCRCQLGMENGSRGQFRSVQGR